MRNKIKVLGLIASILILAQCRAPYVPEYNWPDDLTKNQKEDYPELAADGFKYYKQFCSECHGITNRGKKKIPNFSKQELEDYNLRWQMSRGSIHGELEELTDYHLYTIMTFLEYRKKTEE